MSDNSESANRSSSDAHLLEEGRYGGLKMSKIFIILSILFLTCGAMSLIRRRIVAERLGINPNGREMTLLRCLGIPVGLIFFVIGAELKSEKQELPKALPAGSVTQATEVMSKRDQSVVPAELQGRWCSGSTPMIRITSSTLDLINIDSTKVNRTDVIGNNYTLYLEDGTRMNYRLERNGNQLQGLLPAPTGGLNPPMTKCN